MKSTATNTTPNRALPRKGNKTGASVLYALIPLGLGTAFVESLTSYTRRLSKCHVQRHGDLVNELIRAPHRALANDPFVEPAQVTEALNVLVGATPVLVAYLQALTWVDEVSRTAIGERTPGIYLTRSGRTNRAWCSDCLSTDAVPYDRLLWSFSSYRSCLVHDRALVDRCVGCNKSHRPLRGKTGANRCPHCGGELSATPGTARVAGSEERLLAELLVRLERGDQVTHTQVRAGVLAWVKATGGKLYVTAARIARRHGSLANMLRKRTPMGLENLLRAIEDSGETLDEFFAHPDQPWHFRAATGHGGHKPSPSAAHLEPVLRAILAGPDAKLPPLSKFALTHGISFEALRKQLPSLCDELVARGVAFRHARQQQRERDAVAQVEAAMARAWAETGRCSNHLVAAQLLAAAAVGPGVRPGVMRSKAIVVAMKAYRAELTKTKPLIQVQSTTTKTKRTKEKAA